MRLEDDVFKKTHPDFTRLVSFGFVKSGNAYSYSEDIMAGTFRADIRVALDGRLSLRLLERALDEEYLAIHITAHRGNYVSQVREACRELLEKIRDNCFVKEPFLFPQTNRLTRLIAEKYGDAPEHLWTKLPGYAVFRNPDSKKWYGIVMNIDGLKIKREAGEKEILNLKAGADRVPDLLTEKGILPAYHSNRKNWMTLILDDTLSDERIMQLVGQSRALAGQGTQVASEKREWLVPANPKYFDLEKAFRENPQILWKQSTGIAAGDTVYIYVASPVSAITYRCRVLETGLPYDYKDGNLTIRKVMKIELEKRYDPAQFPFNDLKKYGVHAVRGPRLIPSALHDALENSR